MQLEQLVDRLIPLAFGGTDASDWQVQRDSRAADERDLVERLCDEIQHLSYTTLGPDKFFEYFLQKTARIYRARCVAIWVLNETDGQPCLAAEASANGRVSRQETDYDVRGLVKQFDAQHPAVEKVVEAEPEPNGFVEQDDLIVWGPVCANGQTIAVIAVNLGAGRGSNSETVAGYLARMEHLANCLLGYLQNRHRRAELPTPSFESAKRSLELTGEMVDSRRESIRQLIEQDLGPFAGIRFPTLQENREFAAKVHELLDANGLRSQCPECGSAAILRCVNTGNSKTGVFSFDHYIEGRRKYHCGVTSFPKLKICNKPLRRTRSKDSTS